MYLIGAFPKYYIMKINLTDLPDAHEPVAPLPPRLHLEPVLLHLGDLSHQPRYGIRPSSGYIDALNIRKRTALPTSVANDPLVFTIMEKAPTRAFSWLKTPTKAFTFKTMLKGH